MNAEELDALPVLSVVIDADGVAWQKEETGLWHDIVTGSRPPDGYGSLSLTVSENGPLILLVPATDSGAERLAALRKAVE